MRRLLGRWVAIVALVAGVGVGATALPAAADTPSASTTSSSSTSSAAPSRGGVRPNDWWY